MTRRAKGDALTFLGLIAATGYGVTYSIDNDSATTLGVAVFTGLLSLHFLRRLPTPKDTP